MPFYNVRCDTCGQWVSKESIYLKRSLPIRTETYLPKDSDKAYIKTLTTCYRCLSKVKQLEDKTA